MKDFLLKKGEELPLDFFISLDTEVNEYAKELSQDKIVQVGCAIISFFDNKTEITYGANCLSSNWDPVIPKEIWEKKDYNINQNILLNKRDFIIHAEKKAYQNFVEKFPKSSDNYKDCIVYTTAVPCPDCLVFMIEAGFRNFVYGETKLCSSDKEEKTKFLVQSYNDYNPNDRINFISLLKMTDYVSQLRNMKLVGDN